jgi:hypothetical protein
LSVDSAAVGVDDVTCVVVDVLDCSFHIGGGDVVVCGLEGGEWVGGVCVNPLRCWVGWREEMGDGGLSIYGGCEVEFGEELTVVVYVVVGGVAFVVKLVVSDGEVSEGLGVVQGVRGCGVRSVEEYLLDQVQEGELAGGGDASCS